MTKTVKIDGMMCMKCVGRVENALKALGVDCKVSLENKEAVITADVVDDGKDKDAIEDLGFTVTEIA